MATLSFEVIRPLCDRIEYKTSEGVWFPLDEGATLTDALLILRFHQSWVNAFVEVELLDGCIMAWSLITRRDRDSTYTVALLDRMQLIYEELTRFSED